MGGPGGIRTHDRFLKRELLYRLSYGPDSCILLRMRLLLLLVVEIGFADQFGGIDDLADFAILGFELVAAGQFLVLGQETGQLERELFDFDAAILDFEGQIVGGGLLEDIRFGFGFFFGDLLGFVGRFFVGGVIGQNISEHLASFAQIFPFPIKTGQVAINEGGQIGNGFESLLVIHDHSFLAPQRGETQGAKVVSSC